MIKKIASFILRKRVSALSAKQPTNRVFVWFKKAKEVTIRTLNRNRI